MLVRRVRAGVGHKHPIGWFRRPRNRGGHKYSRPENPMLKLIVFTARIKLIVFIARLLYSPDI
jgi:hypothetical protein